MSSPARPAELAASASANATTKGTPLDVLSAQAEVVVMQEKVFEAMGVAHSASLQTGQLKKRLDEFLFEESDHSKNTVEGVSVLLTTTNSLSSRLSSFEGHLVRKLQGDLEEQDARLLKGTTEMVDKMGSEVRRVLVTFKEEILSLRDELGGLTSVVAAQAQEIQSLKFTQSSRAGQVDARIRAVRKQVGGGLSTLCRQKIESVMRRGCLNKWTQFLRGRQLEQRQRRMLAAFLDFTSTGVRRKRFNIWASWLAKRKALKQQKTMQEFIKRIRYGSQLNALRRWQTWAAEHKVRRQSLEVLQDVVHRFIKSTIFGARKLAWQQWTKFVEHTQQQRRLKHTLEAFLKSTSIGRQRVALHAWLRFYKERKTEKSKRALADAVRSCTSKGLRVTFWRKWAQFQKERKLESSRKMLADAVRSCTSKGLRVVFFRKLKDFARLRKLEKSKRTLADAIGGATSKGLRVIFMRKWRDFMMGCKAKRALKRQGDFIRSMTAQGLRHVYFRRWVQWLAVVQKRSSSGEQPPVVAPQSGAQLEEVFALVQDQVAPLQQQQEQTDSQVFLLKADLQVLQLDVRCLQKEVATSVRGLCQDQEHMREEWKLELVESRVQDEVQEQQRISALLRDQFAAHAPQPPPPPPPTEQQAEFKHQGGMESPQTNQTCPQPSVVSAPDAVSLEELLIIDAVQRRNSHGKVSKRGGPLDAETMARRESGGATPMQDRDFFYCLRDWVHMVEKRLVELEA